jgi:two-component system, chemotaxis family, CheB/CheR fusion protein
MSPISKSNPFPVVGVGASAGGLEALRHLLQHLPVDTGMAFVLVQHLDPDHPSALTELLARTTSMPVHEITNNLRVQPNHIYVIPPNANMILERGKLKLQRRQLKRGAHRTIDRFFESIAQDLGERAIGVILSGTASDGTLGLEAIKADGGITFAQDDSAKYDSMPRNAIAAGCVDLVLSPEMMAQELARIARHPSLKSALQAREQPARRGQAGRPDIPADASITPPQSRSKTASKECSSCCAIIPVSISRSTGPAPFIGASAAVWS